MKFIKENRMRINLSDALTLVFIFTMQCHLWLEASELSQYGFVQLFRNLCFCLALVCVALKWNLRTAIKIKQIFILMLLLTIIIFEAKISGGLTVIKLILFGLAIKEASLRNIIRYITNSNLLILLAICTSVLFDVIDNKVKIDIDGELIYCYGFKNPNTMALMICVILFGVTFLNYEKIKIHHLLIIVIESIFIDKFLGCRSVFYTFNLLVILVFFDKYTVFGEKILVTKYIKNIVMLLFPVFTISSYLLAKMYTTNVVVKRLNLIFSWRFYLWNRYITNLGINLWGHDLSKQELGTLDNGYLVLVYQYGVIVWLIYMLMFSYVLLTAYKLKNRCIIILTIVYELYLLVEGYPILINANIILLIFFVYFWKNGKKNYD